MNEDFNRLDFENGGNKLVEMLRERMRRERMIKPG